MPLFKRTQKSVAARLKGNLDYYTRPSLLRSMRGWLFFFAIVLGLAAIPAFYWLKGPEKIFNVGPISRAHAPIANDCNACHPNLGQIKAKRTEAREILREAYWQRIDQSCQTCHTGFALHVPNTVNADSPATPKAAEASSCTSCHREHLTANKMVDPTEANCMACHNRADLMKVSAELGAKIPANKFPGRKPDGLVYFQKQRPAKGYTEVFAQFDKGHPEFQIHEDKLKDPNPLRYNHYRHEQADIPPTDKGERLQNNCAFCHKPDNRGNFQKLTFENNCRTCHAIKFDPNTPGMEIPHGRPSEVREFLRALDIKYVEYFTKRGDGAKARENAGNAIRSLIQTYGVASGDGSFGKLETQVFYNGVAPSGGNNPFNRNLNLTERAQFTGCAYCHTVSPAQANITPVLAKTVIPDRWLVNGEFNHAKHTMMGCVECHNTIPKSRETADINIPTQHSCTECHNSGAKGVKNDCNSCHHYHAPGYKTVMSPNTTDALDVHGAPVVAQSMKAMMLGTK
jgi:Doubled CXXCH motif (Paired_CXXCH_1)